MGKPRERLRVHLFQVRDHGKAQQQELDCFLHRCRLRPDQLTVHNVVEEPAVAWRTVDGADAVMIGGAGRHSVTEHYPFTEPLSEVLLRLLEEGRPFFGSCWGHQLLGRVLGAQVVTDSERAEVGTYQVRVTPAGDRDPLLAGFAPTFNAQLGHHDHVEGEPEEIEILAATERCGAQVIRARGKPAYGTQFHSELTMEDMRERVEMYDYSYLEGGRAGAQDFYDRLRPSPQADRLLDRFLTLFT